MNTSIAPIIALLLCAGAQADPGYYVVTPYPEGGVRSLDVRYWTVKFPRRPEVVWPELGVGYGFNDRWYSEVFASWIGSSQMATRVSSWNWQNEIMLTQGEWPVDVALHLQAIRNVGVGNTLEFGPVLQTDIGRTQLNFNAMFERSSVGGALQPTQLKLQWQVRHRAWPGLHVGAQGFSEVGTWNDWSPARLQSHRAGPALFGNLAMGDGATLHLQGAWVFGKVYGQRARMLTLRARTTF